MTDNIIKSTDVNSEKPVKKPAAKKAAPKKAPASTSASQPETKDGFRVVVFESGASYSSGDYRFTQDNKIQEVPSDIADLLLSIDNFRLPTQEEVDEYFTSKED